MKALRSLLIASLLAAATSAAAQESPWKFEYHGFVSGSLYAQDTPLGARPGDGGQFLFATNVRATQDKLILGGDARQSRMNFSISGPKVFGGATPKAVAEVDFFGGPGAGQYGMENTLPRLRVAYVELKWGDTTVIAGQFHHLIIAQLPVAVGHIANPVVTTAGLVGWRTPGVTLLHSVAMEGMKLEFGAQVAQTTWQDASCNLVGPGTVTGGAGGSPTLDPALCPANSSAANGGTAARGNGISAGKAGLPMVELRGKAEGKAGDLGWMGYVVGHFDRKDMTGWDMSATLNPPAAPAVDPKRTANLDGLALELGTRLQFNPVVVAVNAYAGKNLANLAGSMYNQFQSQDAGSTIGVNGGVLGGVKERGAWAQVGFFATKELSFYATYGIGQNDRPDIRKHYSTAASSRLETDIFSLLAKYTDGAATFGLEYGTTKTIYNGVAGLPAATGLTDPATGNKLAYSTKYYGSQVMATLLYTF